MSIPVALIRFGQYREPLGFIEQGSPSFRFIGKFKLLVIQQLLLYNINVLYSDSDIVIIKNPLEFLSNYTTDDMLFQRDGTICTGFFYARNTMQSRKLLQTALVYTDIYVGDQKSMIHSYITNNITPTLLPQDQFSSGEYFFNHHQFYWDPLSPKTYMFHNNYIRGSVCKKYRMLEMNITREVKHHNNKYITSMVIDGNKESIRNTLNFLVIIGNVLGRTIIIPPVNCTIVKSGICNIANYDRPRCYSDILNKAKYGFREIVNNLLQLIYRATMVKTVLIISFQHI